MRALEPRIGKDDEDAARLCIAEDLGDVELRLAEHRAHRRAACPCTLVDELDEIFADLEPDVRAIRILRRALEQELRIGAADFDLELARGIERRALAAKLLEEDLERVDVLADPHAVTTARRGRRSRTASR